MTRVDPDTRRQVLKSRAEALHRKWAGEPMAQTWRQARRPERQSRTSAERQSTGGSDPTIGGNAGTGPIGIGIGGQVWIT